MKAQMDLKTLVEQKNSSKKNTYFMIPFIGNSVTGNS